uniref:Hemocyanin C-terminal domain-containing protein n=1 Tax=Cuerna arida TaxID=1464854 RepID=A0A1B6FJL3_9HEMI
MKPGRYRGTYRNENMLGYLVVATLVVVASCRPYDPDDPYLDSVLLGKDVDFEAFYPREAYGVENGSSRPSHGHASFYQHRNPALVDAKNSPAYGYRFDGGRRFNFDD